MPRKAHEILSMGMGENHRNGENIEIVGPEC